MFDPLLHNKLDLHEKVTLGQLSEYDHLRRIMRLCTIHHNRNIDQGKCSEDVKALMKSLACISHPDWEGTIRDIIQMGGKAALGVYEFDLLHARLNLCRLGEFQGKQ
jgi:hypothetical protein